MQWSRSRLHTRGDVARPLPRFSLFCEHSKPVFPANHPPDPCATCARSHSSTKIGKKPQGHDGARAAVESFTATRPRVGSRPHRRVSLLVIRRVLKLTTMSLTHKHAFASADCRSTPAADPTAYLRRRTRARRAYSRGSPKPLGQCQGQLSAPEPQQFYSRRKTKPARAWPQVRSSFETSVSRLSVNPLSTCGAFPKRTSPLTAERVRRSKAAFPLVLRSSAAFPSAAGA